MKNCSLALYYITPRWHCEMGDAVRGSTTKAAKTPSPHIPVTHGCSVLWLWIHGPLLGVLFWKVLEGDCRKQVTGTRFLGICFLCPLPVCLCFLVLSYMSSFCCHGDVFHHALPAMITKSPETMGQNVSFLF